jgi:hypothetical protein
MPEQVVLPELARSLRAFGAPRDAAADAANAAIFTPLLDARARAGLGDVEAALSALRGDALAVRLRSRVAEAAVVGIREPAAARARSARAAELLEPLLAELASLDRFAARARGGTTDDPAWREWVSQLRRVFASADDACRALATLLGGSSEQQPRARYWFRR